MSVPGWSEAPRRIQWKCLKNWIHPKIVINWAREKTWQEKISIFLGFNECQKAELQWSSDSLFSFFFILDIRQKKLREEEVENIMKTMLAILMKKIGKTRDTVTWEFTFSLHPPKVAIYTHTMNGKFYHAEKKSECLRIRHVFCILLLKWLYEILGRDFDVVF